MDYTVLFSISCTFTFLKCPNNGPDHQLNVEQVCKIRKLRDDTLNPFFHLAFCSSVRGASETTEILLEHNAVGMKADALPNLARNNGTPVQDRCQNVVHDVMNASHHYIDKHGVVAIEKEGGLQIIIITSESEILARIYNQLAGEKETQVEKTDFLENSVRTLTKMIDIGYLFR